MWVCENCGHMNDDEKQFCEICMRAREREFSFEELDVELLDEDEGLL